ncbi:hypothetical protein J1N35_002793 [Gossypium stocksii]|uniref:CCHC-type domain-containing protein n=1 Tax=Gossypium stocksii TaxID=47602 RepID=A0A9D4AKW6_9ROSI|nr:hypothetical protein J1N35_002793 [Gossypium stocksii]
MELTVIIKLLRRNIGYGALNSRISTLRSPTKPFHLMDIENGYFLAKFQSVDDYTKVLSRGPWMVYGQYLTVQPWMKDFCPSQPYPKLVLAWIRLPGLPGHLYKKKIIEEIGSTIGKVVRLDFNTDSRIRGRFARMAAYINLDKPLVAQVIVNDRNQKVGYEALPTICFSCGKYGHTKELCVVLKLDPRPEKLTMSDGQTTMEEGERTATFGPWMVVERKSRRNFRNTGPIRAENKEKTKSGSRFGALAIKEGRADLGKEHDKGNEGDVAVFQGKLKVAELGGQKISFRDISKDNKNSRLGGVILDNGSFNSNMTDPISNEPIVESVLSEDKSGRDMPSFAEPPLHPVVDGARTWAFQSHFESSLKVKHSVPGAKLGGAGGGARSRAWCALRHVGRPVVGAAATIGVSLMISLLKILG